MKKLNEARQRKIMILAFVLLGIIAGIATLTAPKKAAAGVGIAIITVGGVSLSDNEEKVYNALKETISNEIAKFDKGYITETKMLEIIAQKISESKINIADDESFKKLQTALEKQGLELQAVKEIQLKHDSNKSIEEQIQDQLKGQELIEAMQAAPGQKLKLIVKAPNSPMTMGNTINPASAYIPQPTVDYSWDRSARNARFLRLVSNTATTTSPIQVWAEKYNEDGGAAMVAEGGLKPLFSFQIRTRDTKAKKIAVRAKFTTEVMQDIPNFTAELNSEILEQIEIREEDQFLKGTGLGEDLLGIIPQSFGYVLLTVKCQEANNFDAIKAVVTQILTLNHVPNICFVNPIDKANMELVKDLNGNYVLPPFSTVNGATVSGVQVIESNSIEVGKFLIGDFTKHNIRDYVATEITVGWENDDFSKNLVTVIGEKRLLTYIKEHQKTAFVYADFAAMKAAIEIV